MFYVYILQGASSDKIYIGFSTDLKQRLKNHKEKTVKTTQKENYRLIFYCSFFNKYKALEFERYLKHGSGHAFARKHLI
jgi:putative endonuclease